MYTNNTMHNFCYIIKSINVGLKVQKKEDRKQLMNNIICCNLFLGFKLAYLTYLLLYLELRYKHENLQYSK